MGLVGQVIIILSLFLGQVAANLHLKRFFDLPVAIPADFTVERYSPEVFKAITFGHLPAAVDWLLVRFLVSSGHKKKDPTQIRSHAFYDLDLATDLDPAFLELYTAGANLLTVALDDSKSAQDLLEKGNRFRKRELPGFPDSFRSTFWASEWGVPLILAYVYLFEFDDLPQAAKVFTEAADVKGAPTYLIDLKHRIQKPGGVYEVGLRLLNFMIAAAPTAEAKAKLLKKRDSLFVAQYVFHLNESFKNFLDSQAQYQRDHVIGIDAMRKYYVMFLKESGQRRIDPWGGELSLSMVGKIMTTTPYEPVLGLK